MLPVDSRAMTKGGFRAEPPRQFAIEQAKGLNVTGHVLNASDGSVRFPCPSNQRALTYTAQVQGEAQGSEDALKEFVQHLNQGPSHARVTGVEQSDISTKSGESGFHQK